MSTITRPIISFLSLAHDPEPPMPQPSPLGVRQGQCVRSLANALAQLGWQVDIFTHHHQPNAPNLSWITPHCRVIRLAVEPSGAIAHPISQVVQHIQSVQIKSGLLSPLFHTFDELSAQVGEHIKRKKNWRWIHSDFHSTSHTLDPAALALADQRVIFQAEPPAVTVTQIDEVSQARHQRYWEAIALNLNYLYRQHLAIYVGALGLEIPDVCYLPAHERDTDAERILSSQDWYPAAHSA